MSDILDEMRTTFSFSYRIYMPSIQYLDEIYKNTWSSSYNSRRKFRMNCLILLIWVDLTVSMISTISHREPAVSNVLMQNNPKDLYRFSSYAMVLNRCPPVTKLTLILNKNETLYLQQVGTESIKYYLFIFRQLWFTKLNWKKTVISNNSFQTEPHWWNFHLIYFQNNNSRYRLIVRYWDQCKFK